MSRFVRIEVDAETLVDALHAYVADPPAVRRRREYLVLRELGGPGTYVRTAYGVRSNWPYPVLRDALRLNWEVLEMMRLDGVCEREVVAALVAWSLSARVTPGPRETRRLPGRQPTRRETEVLRLVAAAHTGAGTAPAGASDGAAGGVSSGRYSRMSPGWQARARQIPSRVEKRMALALPFLRIERLAIVMPTRSASSVTLIFRLASITSMWTIVATDATSDRQVVF
jgi:hypothetical protein